jgi:hypothetical protein
MNECVHNKKMPVPLFLASCLFSHQIFSKYGEINSSNFFNQSASADDV